MSITYGKNFIPDFVIKKKRKRAHPADPCLGFYRAPSSPFTQTFGQEVSYKAINIFSVSPLTSTPQADSVPSLDIPEWTHTFEATIDAEVEGGPRNDVIKVVTVDEFLRRSAEKPRKNYGKRKHKVVNLTSESQEVYSFSPSPTIMDMTSDRPNRRKKARLAERLIQAAVLAHADPAERLRRRRDPKVFDCSSRQPLSFIPVNQVCSPVKTALEGRSVTLVNPQKALRFRKHSFSAQGSLSRPSVEKSLERKPMTHWETPRRQFPHASNRKNRSKTSDKSSRVPLSFIPFQDAEREYSSRLHSAERAQLSKLSVRTTAFPPKSRRNDVFLPKISSIIPLETLHKDQMPDRPSKRVKFSSPTDNIEIKAGLTYIAPPVIFPSTLPPQDHDFPCTPGPSVLNGNSPADGLGSAEALDIPTSELHDGLQLAPKKPLKALASFLGSFLETARHATQTETLTKPRISFKHGPTERISSSSPTSNAHILTYDIPEEYNGDRVRLTPRLQPLNSMRSFIRTAIRNPSSSVAEFARQPSPLAKPVLLRTLTSRSHLLFKSIKSEKVTSPLSVAISHSAFPAVPSAPGLSAATASQSSITQIAYSRRALSPLPNTTLVHSPVFPSSKTLLSSAHSPSEILAALLPHTAQVVLSSNSFQSANSSPSSLRIAANERLPPN